MGIIRLMLASSVSALLLGCLAGNDVSQTYDVGRVEFEAATEISGIAASRIQPRVLWAHNDSGDSPRIFAMNHQGQHLAQVVLEGADAIDWEDMSLQYAQFDAQFDAKSGGGNDGENAVPSYLYVGDIGDNFARRDTVTIYRIHEPLLSKKPLPSGDRLQIPPQEVSALRVSYPDQPRDAEALMFDPWTGDLYILSKRETRQRLYRIAHDTSSDKWVKASMASEHRVHVAALVATLPAPSDRYPRGKIVAADISADGSHVMIKTYEHLLYWKRQAHQSIEALLLTEPVMLPYVKERQGEAVAWSERPDGYFTVSEGEAELIRFYPRVDTVPNRP